MSNLLDKVNKIGAAGVIPEEFKETWGVTQEAEVSSMMKFIKRQQFEARIRGTGTSIHAFMCLKNVCK